MIDVINSKTTYLGKASGGNKYALDAFIGAVKMVDPVYGLQDIKPSLVRDTDGWHVEGAPYYAEVKDNGDRLFCPDKYERSKYIRLPNVALFSGLSKSLSTSKSILDGELLVNKVVMLTDYGSISFQFTNTGMYLPIDLNSAPKVDSKSIDRLTLDVDSTFDIAKLISSKDGLGIVPGYIVDSGKGVARKYRRLEWSYKNGRLELGFDLAGLEFPLKLVDAIDVQVGAGANDGVNWSGYWGFDTGWEGMQAGYSSGGDFGNSSMFMRFTGITIPAGSTITTSYMQVYGYDWTYGTPQLKVFGVDADNPAAPVNASQMTGAALTAAGVDWDGAWTAGNWNQSPSINAVIQELLDSYTISNDAVMFQVRNDGGTTDRYNTCYAYDYDSSLAARLHIEYTETSATTKNASETAANTEGSSLTAILVEAETVSGSDVINEYPAALQNTDESGSGENSSIVVAALTIGEISTSSEAASIALVSGDVGVGIELGILEAALLTLIAGDVGVGIELGILEAALITLIAEDVGVGTELGLCASVVLVSGDAGDGTELGLCASVVLVSGDAGGCIELGIEAALITIITEDVGTGIELGILEKMVLLGECAIGRDSLKSLVKTGKSGTDIRLHGHKGNGKIPSKQGKMPSGHKRMPSRGVNI